MCSHGFSLPLVSLSSTMWRHSLSSKIGQAPRRNAFQPWWHANNPPSLQAKHSQPFGHEHHRSSRAWPVGTFHLWRSSFWGSPPTHQNQAYSSWGGFLIVPAWIGPNSFVPLHFRVHLGPPEFSVRRPQLIPAGLLGLWWVPPTWSLVLAYGSSWVPSPLEEASRASPWALIPNDAPLSPLLNPLEGPTM